MSRQEIINDFVEKGGPIEHDRWASWQEYVFSKCTHNDDGSCTIPQWAVHNWSRQIKTSYENLSEEAKEKDRYEVRSYIPLLKEALDLEKAEAIKHTS